MITAEGSQAEASFTDVSYEALKASPQLSIGPIKFKTEDDIFDGVMKVNIDGDALPSRDSFNLMDINMWVSTATQSLDVRASEGLADPFVDIYLTLQSNDDELAVDREQKRSEILAHLLAQDMIVRAENGYAVDMDMDYGQGEITLNGNIFPIEALLGP